MTNPRNYPWKWIVSVAISNSYSGHTLPVVAGQIAMDGTSLIGEVQVANELNAAQQVEFDVRPGSERVWGQMGDDYARLAQTNRIVFGFRREGPPGTVWTCRAAGILMVPNDQGDPDSSLTHFVAYDPWKLLESRPAMDTTGSLPPRAGWIIFDTPPNIIKTYLQNTIDFGDGGIVGGYVNNVFINPVPFHEDDFFDTDKVIVEIQQGTSVADVWGQLCDMGACDIVLRPQYPGPGDPYYTHRIGIYKTAGTKQNGVRFAYGMLERNVLRVARVHDATPGNFQNLGRVVAGQGGTLLPLPPSAPLDSGFQQINDFGPYWTLNTQVQQSAYSADETAALGALHILHQTLTQSKQGKRTVSLDPVPGKAAVPLLDYNCGDTVQVFAPADLLRAEMTGYQRVMSIPITISADGIETVAGMTVIPDTDSRPLDPPP